MIILNVMYDHFPLMSLSVCVTFRFAMIFFIIVDHAKQIFIPRFVSSIYKTLCGIVPKAPGARVLFFVLVARYRPTPFVNVTPTILFRNARVIILNTRAHSVGFCATNADRSARSGSSSQIVDFV